jgi:hypothetical protein
MPDGDLYPENLRWGLTHPEVYLELSHEPFIDHAFCNDIRDRDDDHVGSRTAGQR